MKIFLPNPIGICELHAQGNLDSKASSFKGNIQERLSKGRKREEREREREREGRGGREEKFFFSQLRNEPIH